MSSPRIEVDLRKIRHNTQTAVDGLQACGIGVTGVTKAVCGHPTIAQAMLDGGVLGLADARINNIERLRKAGITRPITLIRTPMLSQADAVVQFCEASYNTQMVVIRALAAAASRTGKVHGVILMVEMGDLREGIMPQDLGEIARQVGTMPGVTLKGVGANFACLSGVAPDAAMMAAFSALVNDVEQQNDQHIQTVSGGNSANLPWALGGHDTGRTNDLRLGEAILLGVDPVSGCQIDGMYRDAFTLIAEIIETDKKPPLPHVSCTEPALASLRLVPKAADTPRVILAIGQQDTDISGLSMAPDHWMIGATSDHLIIGTKRSKPRIGSEIKFQMNYSALMHAMAAPDVETYLLQNRASPKAQGSNRDRALA